MYINAILIHKSCCDAQGHNHIKLLSFIVTRAGIILGGKHYRKIYT